MLEGNKSCEPAPRCFVCVVGCAAMMGGEERGLLRRGFYRPSVVARGKVELARQAHFPSSAGQPPAVWVRRSRRGRGFPHSISPRPPARDALRSKAARRPRHDKDAFVVSPAARTAWERTPGRSRQVSAWRGGEGLDADSCTYARPRLSPGGAACLDPAAPACNALRPAGRPLLA